jgi:hypothetical protein
MSLKLESITDQFGNREDSHIYKDYDFLTKIMLRLFDIQKA